jgi:quinolinate synthase
MNSSAAIKAFVGEHGGAVCTSSNCEKVFRWALAGGETPLREGESVKILFLPDQHLGRNTAAAMGYHVETDMLTWDPNHEDGFGGHDEDTIDRATFLLWKGHCSVHKLFRPEHVDQIRRDWPDVTVMVHPECAYEVCQKADRIGSTEQIRKALEAAEPGSRWAIGTEVHMVDRLCRQAAERGVQARILSDCQCLCTTMYRIDMPHLLYVMDKLAEGEVVNQIKVPEQTQHWSLVALDRMLHITGSSQRLAPTPAKS